MKRIAYIKPEAIEIEILTENVLTPSSWGVKDDSEDKSHGTGDLGNGESFDAKKNTGGWDDEW